MKHIKNIKLNTDIKSCHEIIDSNIDPELVEMASIELSEFKAELTKINDLIEKLLLPRDPEDSYDCIVGN